MLRDRYEHDPWFWTIIEQLAIEMDPELAQIDRILDDDVLFQMIKNDMAQRYPQTLETGRNSTPVEVNLRMLAVKRLYRFTYRQPHGTSGTVWCSDGFAGSTSTLCRIIHAQSLGLAHQARHLGRVQ